MVLLQMAKDAERLSEQAERIIELRKGRRETQPDVAEAVGVTLRAYQNWEAAVSDPKAPNVKALAKHFETTPDFIEFGEERRSPGATPDLLDHLAEPDLREQLDRIEDVLSDLVERLVGAGVLAAVERDSVPGRQPARRARPSRAA